MGIGDINLPELLNISSDPDIHHVFLLKNFDDAPYFTDFLISTTCESKSKVLVRHTSFLLHSYFYELNKMTS